MNIYQISRDDDSVGYDEFDAFVVAATSEEEARSIASTRDHEFGKAWMDPNFASCKLVGRACSKTVAGIVLGSFNAA